eukprot:1442539-Lingulodinium_polyedra.AAC.1
MGDIARVRPCENIRQTLNAPKTTNGARAKPVYTREPMNPLLPGRPQVFRARLRAWVDFIGYSARRVSLGPISRVKQSLNPTNQTF